MSGLNYFIFNGTKSLDEQLIVVDKSTYKGAARDITFTQIPGRSGDLLIDNKRYKNVKITYDVTALEGTSTIPEIAHRLKSWLLSEVGYFAGVSGRSCDYGDHGKWSGGSVRRDWGKNRAVGQVFRIKNPAPGSDPADCGQSESYREYFDTDGFGSLAG